MKKKSYLFKGVGLPLILVLLVLLATQSTINAEDTRAQSDIFKESIYQVGKMKPRDSVLTLKVGDKAPDFSLPFVGGLRISLSEYLEKKNVVISFVPAAWTPVCSRQWPEYNKAKDIFDKNETILLGITVDNIPTLHSWMKNMCGGDKTLWFPVLSDFYPHGSVAKKYGVLRSEGLSERALFVIDKKGIIRYIDVHDINEKPKLEVLVKVLEELKE
jgi:peroxiredoxin (alkyl hydroperoxide reductase subunit C)